MTRVLLLHNRYQQRGGEDSVVDAETNLLREAGHEVFVELVDNHAITSLPQKLNAFARAPYDPAREAWAADLTRRTRADVVHIHNFFPLLTPAAHVGAMRAGAAVVQTLHNYRLLCANALFLRNGSVCESCLGGSRLPAVTNRCYRGSLAGSLAVTRMQDRAQARGSWRSSVDRFIALTTFARDKFVSGGLPGELIAIKPNFVDQPRLLHAPERSGAIYVGRLSSEKGIHVLLQAWKQMPDVKLTIIGDGPERQRLEAMSPGNVVFAGAASREEVFHQMARAQLMIIPSLWYEGFPVTVVEALASGLPVLGSRIGGLAEIIPNESGLCLFGPGDAAQLAHNARALLAANRLAKAGEEARAAYLAKYTPKQNLAQLERVYAEAMDHRDQRLGMQRTTQNLAAV